MKRLSLLGSTGSIGCSTLDVVERFPDRFSVVGLAAGRNVDRLIEQARRHRPTLVAVAEPGDVARVRGALPDVEVLAGQDGRIAVATHPDADTVVGAFVGALGLRPTWRAIQLGRDVLLANKETLVVAGELVMAEATVRGARILPIDSEHNALHQALRGGRPEEVARLVLTASGGPFRTFSRDELARVTVEAALAHPTWSMGPKITVDSATMMNKGLEIIEAHHLFSVPEERIAVVVHPESRVHSLVEFVDGTLLAQLSVNDMRFPILYALTFPDRVPSPFGALDLVSIGALHFEAADEVRFPALALARAALRAGGTAPAMLNAANEVAVAAFLAGRLPYLGIAEVVSEVLEHVPAGPLTSLDDALAADREGRARAFGALEKFAPPSGGSS